MDGWKAAWVWLCAAAVAAPSPVESGARAVAPSAVRMSDPFTASAVRGALQGATRRLDRPDCQKVFGDFADAHGRRLEENLAALGDSGRSYMGRLLFYEGTSQPLCHKRNALAITQPGSRVVLVCGPAFTHWYRRDRFLAEAVLIHEALHTLGLGENPPSSQEITKRVLERCHQRANGARVAPEEE